jgi:hypothetical protein
MYEIYLWKGYEKEFLDTFSHLALMSGLSMPKNATLIAKKIYEFNWHYVGPKEVPITQQGYKNIKKSVKILKTIGTFSGEFNRSKKVIMAVCDSLAEFHNIALSYKRKDLDISVLKALKEIKKACYVTYEENKKKFLVGIRVINNLLKVIKRDLIVNKQEWKEVIAETNNAIVYLYSK